MSSIHYTSAQTAENGEVIKGRITELTGSGGYLIEILANGMAIIDETFTTSRDETTARGMAYIAAASYIFRLNNPGFGQADAPAASASPVVEDVPMSDMAAEPAMFLDARDETERRIDILQKNLAQALEAIEVLQADVRKLQKRLCSMNDEISWMQGE